MKRISVSRFRASLFMLLIASAAFGQTDNRAIYDQYISTYKTYKDAISNGLPEAEVKKALEAYTQAKSAYESTLSAKTDDGQPATSADLSNSVTSSAADSSDLAGDEAPSSRSATATAQIPAEIRSMVQALWSDANRRSPDKAIATIEKFVAMNPNSPYAAQLKYEVAKAYEQLKGDVNKATALLKEIAADSRHPAMAAEAQARLRFYDANKQYAQWKNTLNTKYSGLAAEYGKYRDTSWLAFPVKIFRFGSYFKDVWSFTNTQDDYVKFMIAYENLAARFQPAPDVSFDQFETSTGSKIADPAEVRLLYDNSKSWYTRWKLVNEARRSIDVQYFIVDKDIFGLALQGALLRKAREGLKIRFMMDARGTKGFTRKLMGQDFVQELVSYPNVEVKVFNPVHENLVTFVLDPRKIMASNHDKILVVDGEYSVVGGRNISSHYFVDPEDMPTAYRDCDVVVRSTDVADQLDKAFDEEFTERKQTNIVADLWGNIDVMSKELELAFAAMGAHITGSVFTPSQGLDSRRAKALEEYRAELAGYKHMKGFSGFDPFAGSHEAPVKIIDKHSLAGPRNDITDCLIKFIDGSRSEIVMQNPYVVLSDRVMAALKRASARRVRIIVHTNSPVSTDSLATQAMFYADWKNILKNLPTARIFTFAGQRKLHAKNFVFDNKVAVVGTYNLDSLSEEVNSEVVAAIKSRGFANELRTGIMSDISVSKEYRIEIDKNGDVKAVFGPDDLPGKKMWLMKALSKLTFLKSMI
ncbi:MAG TPA: phospholipase D-like domain-containing protein [Candidatus Ozemobacteraceae bacterium]|nr:phospholipase D-like domain-containing protein [Candidatus Ozemobacteraceae bacterium]